MTQALSPNVQVSPGFVLTQTIVEVTIGSAVLVFLGGLVDIAVQYTDALLCLLASIPVGVAVQVLVRKTHGFGLVALGFFSQGSSVLLIHLIIGCNWQQAILLWGACFATNLVLVTVCAVAWGVLVAAIITTASETPDAATPRMSSRSVRDSPMRIFLN